MGFFDGCEGCCSPRAYVWGAVEFYNRLVSSLAYGTGDVAGRPGQAYGYTSYVDSGPPLLGTGGTTIPRQGDWISVSTCDERSYGILADGSLWGWGRGPLGDGTLNTYRHPHRIGTERWRYVSTCKTHTLAIKTDGSLWSWGENDDGQLGNLNYYPTYRESPVAKLSTSIASLEVIEDKIADITSPVSSVTVVGGGATQPASVTCSVNFSVAGATSVLGGNVSESVVEHYLTAAQGGSGYQSVPEIVFTPSVQTDSPQPCIARANCSFYVYGATVVAGGSGYDENTSVVFSPNKYGESAKATCTVSGGSVVSITPTGSAYYDTPPTVTIVGSGSGATATPISNGTVVSVTILSGGSGYTAAPAVSFVGGNPTTAASFIAAIRANSIDLNLTGGGGGYSQASRGEIKVRLLLANNATVDVANVNLTPSGIASVSPPFFRPTAREPSAGKIDFRPFYVRHDLSSVDPSMNFPYPTSEAERAALDAEAEEIISGLEVTAHIVSSEGPDIPLSVSMSIEETASVRRVRWLISLPAPIYGRTKQFLVRVVIPGFDYPFRKTFKPQGGLKRGVTIQPIILERGDAELANSSGKWSIVDKNESFTVFRCNGSEAVEYPPFEETEREFYGAVVNEVRGGDPAWPKEEYIPWGYGFGAAAIVSGYSFEGGDNYHAQSYGSPPNPPEWITNKFRVPDRCLLLSVASVTPASSYPAVTTIVEGDGTGAEVSAAFDPTTRLLSYTIVNAGSGYTYAPSITATNETLVPVRVGVESDWQSVVAISGSTRSYSAGLRSDGWPMRWGQATSRVPLCSLHPEKVGFPLSIRPKKGPALFRQTDTYSINTLLWSIPVSSELVSGLTPQTNGFLPTIGGRYLDTTSMHPGLDTGYSTRYSAGEYRSAFFQYNGLYPHGVDVANVSRRYGGPEGLYLLTNIQSIPSTPTPQQDPYISVHVYRHFVPYDYSAEDFLPEVLPAMQRLGLHQGSCYTSVPELGDEVECSLYAPGPCRSLFVDDGWLMAVSLSGEVWRLQSFSAGMTTHSVVPSQPDPGTRLSIKGYRLESNISWSWETEEREQTVALIISSWAYGDYQSSTREDTFVTKYLLPPTKSVESQQSGWVNEVQVSPFRSWKIRITNPGSGYKSGDSISFRLSGGKTFRFKRVKVQTSQVEIDSVENEVAKYTYPQVSVGDVSVPWYNPAAVTYAGSLGTNVSRGRPPGRIWVQLGSGASVDEVQYETETRQVTYVKKLSCYLKDSYEPELVDEPEIVVAARVAVVGGGLYADLPSQVFYSPSDLFVEVPTVEVISNTGSGSGATAELVPAMSYAGSGDDDFPLKVSTDANILGKSFTRGTSQYGFSPAGVVHFDNPRVSPPATFDPGLTWSPGMGVARSSSRDLYLLRSHPPFSKPIAYSNIELIIGDRGKDYQLPPLIRVSQPSQDIAVVDAKLDGKLVSLGVRSGGSGYRTSPTLTISGGGGSGATARAVISGPVDLVEVTEGGDGYATAPEAVFSSPGLPATATVVARGRVSEIVIGNKGGGYTSTPPEIVITGDGTGASAVAEVRARVSAVTLASGGRGYEAPPTVTLEGGGGTGAEVEAVMGYSEAADEYYVKSFKVTKGGSGYSSAPKVTVSPPPGSGGVTAAGTAVLDFYISSITLASQGSGYSTPPLVQAGPGSAKLGAMLSMSVNGVSVSDGGTYRASPAVSFEPSPTVESISLDSVGSGYKTAPEVHIVGGGGTGAEAVCEINDAGEVSSVTVTSRGRGYFADSPPLVVFVGGGGRGAAATAIVAVRGGGAAATARINGSVLYAEPVLPGGGYQFAPSVTVSGGGNERIAALDQAVQAGEISQSEYDESTSGLKAELLARIEGTVSELTVLNAGNRYSPPPKPYDGHAAAHFSSAAKLHGVLGDNTGVSGVNSNGETDPVLFPATSDYPGGAITSPSSIPRYKFLQKPDVRFGNGTYVNVEREHNAWAACRGMRLRDGSRPTVPANLGSFYARSLFAGSMAVSNGLAFPWKYGPGFSRFRFSSAPLISVSDERGSGSTIETIIDDGGLVTSISVSSQGSNYTSLATLRARRGLLRQTRCEATCVINSSGQLVAVTIQSPGSGYVMPVAIIHNGGGGRGASVAVTLAAGDSPRGISAIKVVDAGAGYKPDTPPSILVYDASGAFEDTIYGRELNERLAARSPWTPLTCPEWVGEYAVPFSQFYDSGGSSAPIVDGELVVDTFMVAEQIESLSVSFNAAQNFSAYSVAPAVSVEGTCERPLVVTSAAAKWTEVVDVGFLSYASAFGTAVPVVIALRDVGP